MEADLQCGQMSNMYLYNGSCKSKHSHIYIGGTFLDRYLFSSASAVFMPAAQAEADVLLYGHTHLPRQEWLDAGERVAGQILQKPLLVCNPGALQDGRFGTLTLNNQGILFGFGSL